MRNITEKSTYPSQNTDNPLFSVELIINPLIHIFEDYKGTNSMAINLGYNYYYNDIIGEKRIDLHMKIDHDILSNLITLISSEYNGKFFAFGFCSDSSYVEFHKKQKMARIFGNSYIQHVIGDRSEVTDNYMWLDSLISKEIDSSLIYSIFPKDMITLPDKEKLKEEEEKLIKLKQEREKKQKAEKFARENMKKEMLSKAKDLVDKGKSIKSLIICGEGGVGKTALALRYLTDKFYTDTIMTNCVNIFLKDISIDDIEFNLFIWDVQGQESARFLAEFFADNVDGAIFCFDLTRARSLENVEEWINFIRKSNQNIPILFLGTKMDLDDEIIVDDEYALLFKDEFNLSEYVKISIKSGENVNNAFNRIINKIKENLTLEEQDIRGLQKKLMLLEYLYSYKIQDIEELKTYFGDQYNDEYLEEEWENWNECKANQLLRFPEFKDKIQKFIDTL